MSTAEPSAQIWPRGVSKVDLDLDDWIKEVAPSTDLRKWFGHDTDRWEDFRRRYRAELDENEEAVERCLAWCRKGPVVLLFGAKDPDHNQAVVLREYLRERPAYRAAEYRAGDAGGARSLSVREAALQEVVRACSSIEHPGCRERRDRNRGGQ